LIEEEFRIEDVNPSPAFFDERKLRAFNGDYIRALPVEEFIAACQPWLTGGVGGTRVAPWSPEDYDPAAFAAVAPLAQTRIAVLSEIATYVDFFFLPEPSVDQASWDKAMKESAGDLLAAAIAAFEVEPSWQAEPLKAGLEAVGAALGIKLGKAQAPVRVAVTGRSIGLPLFESLEVLGRDRTLARLRAAEAALRRS
jgi:glutamyl-tRNA synthetase